MRRVHLNGVSYACPFERLLPPHTSGQFAALRADLERTRRVLLPVITFVSPTHGRCVLDGVTRATLAAELDLSDVPVDHWGDVPDDFARERCLALNVLRRHIDPKDYPEVVLKLRKQGESIRGIAEIAGIPKGRVERILEDARLPTYPNTPPLFDELGDEDEEWEGPETVRGRDGKLYPAGREDDGDEDVPTPGSALPAALERTAAVHALERARKALATLTNAVGELFDSPAEEALRASAKRRGLAIRKGAAEWAALATVGQVLADVGTALG